MLDISLNGLLVDNSQNQSSPIYFEIANKRTPFILWWTGAVASGAFMFVD